MKIYRPNIVKISNCYHIEISHKNTTYDNQIGCYINVHHINGEISNQEDAIRLDIEPDKKEVTIFIDGKEMRAKDICIIL